MIGFVIFEDHSMKLTNKSEYALLALIHLARCGDDAFISVKTIADSQHIPSKFLEQILLTLKRGGYVKSSKGHGGGYRLAKRRESITIAEIIRLIDGALAPTESVSVYFYGRTPIEKERALVDLFRGIRDMVASKLECTTLADVV
ncbi:MAG: Rrf2 family transcriptional regulator [Candidatus Eremiobacteraeota bacterium]|nr:Rrf2 family transcriptional regulator [Candidatus Eremiobacteraeota bacterium]